MAINLEDLLSEAQSSKPDKPKTAKNKTFEELVLGDNRTEKQKEVNSPRTKTDPTFGELNNYDQGLVVGVDKDQARAREQGFAREFRNGLTRVVPNAALGIVGNIGSILDLEDYYNQDKEVGNDLVTWSESMKENVNDALPIYRENPNRSLDWGDSAYWVENGSSLSDSILGFMATGYGVTGAVGKIAQVLKLGKVGQIAQVATTAVTLNQAEAIVSASQIYDQIYNQKLDEGLSEDDAKQSAADAATYVVNINRLNIPLNITSSMAFLRSAKATRTAFINATKTNTAKRLISEGTQEYGEEVINYIAEQEGRRSAQKGYKYDSDRTLDDILSREGFEAGLLGFIGGAGQAMGVSLKNRLDGTTKVNQERYMAQQAILDQYKSMTGQDINNTLQSVKTKADLLNQIQDAANRNEDSQVEDLQSDLLHIQALEAFENGTTEELVQRYKDVLSDPNKEDKFGRDVVERSTEAIRQIERAEKIYNSLPEFENKSEVFQAVSKHDTLIEKAQTLQQRINEVSTKLAKESAIIGEENTVDNFTHRELKNLQREYLNTTNQLKGITSDIKNLTSPETQTQLAQAKNDSAKAKIEETVQGNQSEVDELDITEDGFSEESIQSDMITLSPDAKIAKGEPFIHQGEVYYTESYKTNNKKIVEVTAIDPNTGISHTINLKTNEVQKTPSQGESQTQNSTGENGEVSVPEGISGSDSVNGRDLREETLLESPVVSKLKLETGGLTESELIDIEGFKNYLIERSDKTTPPKLTVKKENKYQFNIYNETGIKVGYLPTLAQMKGLTTDQKRVVNQIKDSLKEGEEVEFKYQINSGIDIVSNLKPLIDRNPSIYSYNSEPVIFRQLRGGNTQETGRELESVLGTLTQEDNTTILNSTSLTDSYVMKVSDLDGTPRYIGLKPVELEDSGYSEISDILNSGREATEIVNELNDKFFVPANPLSGKRFHLEFKVFNGVPTLLLSENSKGSRLQRIFPINGVFNSKEGFMKSLIIEKNKNAIPVKSISEVLSYVSREIPKGSSPDVVLSNLRANTTDRLFGGINIVPVGVEKKRSIISPDNNISTQPIIQPRLSDQVKDGDTIYQVRDPKSGVIEAKTVGVLASGKFTVVGQVYTKDQFDQVGYFRTESEAKASLPKSKALPKKDPNQSEKTRNIIDNPFDGIDMDALFSVQTTTTSPTNWGNVRSELSRILPEGFNLERLSQIARSNQVDGSTMGAFVNNTIYLANQTEGGTHYHEAFHAIFRKVFTPSEQSFYYKVAKTKVDTSILAQESYLKRNPQYQTRDNVESLMLEEYMADQFQSYMNGKPTTILQKFFKFLKGLVNSLLRRGDDLISLFSRVDSGEFTFRSIRNTNGFGDVVYKRVPFAQIQESNELVRLVTIHYLENKTKSSEVDNQLDKILLGLKNESAVDFDSLYNAEVSKVGESNAIESLDQYWYPGEINDGEDPNKAYRKVFNHTEAIKVLKDQVKKNLKSLNATTDSNEDSQVDEAVQSDEVTERDWEQSPFEVNPTSDASVDVKAMIQYTGYYLDGKLTPIDSTFVYNTLLLSLSGLETYSQMYNRLEKLSNTNPQIKGVFKSLQNQVVEDSTFATKFQQSFSLEKVEFTQIEFTEADSSYKVFSANRKDVGDIQMNRWRNQFVKLNRSQITEARSAIKSTFAKISDTRKFGGVKFDQGEVEEYRSSLNKLGIDLSQGLLEDILDDTNPVYKWGNLTGDPRKDFVNELGQVLGIIDEGGNPFGVTDIVIRDKDSDKVKLEKQNQIDSTAITRLRRIGGEDAKFRTDILMTSFQNSEGKTVYPFTAPSHLLTTARKIVDKDPSLMTKFQSKFYQLNPLVKWENIDNNTLNLLKLSIFNGIRESKGEEGQTFKNIDSKSYHLSTLLVWKEGYLNPFQIEAKSIASLFKFPQKGLMFKGGQIAPWVREHLRNFYRQDQTLIQQSLSDLKTLRDDELIEGYHFIGYVDGKPKRDSYDKILQLIKEGKKTNNDLPRGFQVKQLPEMNTLFTHEAIINGQVSDSEIDSYYDDLFSAKLLPQFKSILRDSDLDPDVKSESNLYYDNKSGFESVNDFLMEFLMEDFVYSNSYAQLHRGPEQYYKNGVDITKRAAGQSAAGRSLLDGEFHVALLATTQVEKEVGGKIVKVDPTDAQGHMSGRRHLQVMEKLGRLTPQVKDQLERLIAGEDIEWGGDFTLIPWKNVLFDGDTYIKTSTLPLFKGLTSQLNPSFNQSLEVSDSNPLWVAKPGMDYLHNLREQMDGEVNGVRDPNKPLIDEAYYDTAFKKVQKSKNFQKDGKWSNLQTQVLQNKDWRLQVENPSGKTKVTYGTQLLQLIDSEMKDNHEVEFEGVMVPLSQVRDTYQRLLSEIREDSMTKALSLMDKVIDGDNLFINKLQSGLESSKSDNNTLEFFSQSNGDFKYSTDLPNIQGKFEEMFLSYFSKSVFNQKTAGLKLTLVSSYGVKNPQTGEDLKIHRLEDGKIELAEIILSAEFLSDYNLTLDEFNQLDQTTKDEILTMVGYRIPTQSHHSMIPFKVVGFVPGYYGSIVIAPSEITYLAGSDYDVDSLFVHRKEFRVKGDGSITLYNINKSTEELWGDYVDYNVNFNQEVKDRIKTLDFKDPSVSQLVAIKEILGMDKEKFLLSPKTTNAARYNKILETNLSFLTNVNNAESLFTPASIDSLKDIARDIYDLTGEDENLTIPYQSYVSRYTAWMNNSTGKQNVGNAASANKINAFLTKYGVELTQPVTFDGEQFTGYANPVERDVSLKNGKVDQRITRRKGDSLSTVVSAMTDNAKERLAAKLNLTKNNLSVFSNMISLGMGLNRTMLFAKQPVMVQITKQFTSKSAIIASPGSSYELVGKELTRIEDLLGKNNIVDLEITSEDLINHINDNLTTDSEGGTYKSIKTSDNLNGYLKPEDIQKFQFARNVLKKYQELSYITDDFSKVGRILSLDKEIGIEFSKMDGIEEAHSILTGENSKIDVTSAFERDQNVNQNLLNLSKVRAKAESYFISRTQRFQNDFEGLVQLGVKNVHLTKLRRDYVTYLALRRVEADLNTNGKSLSQLLPLIKGDDSRITKQFDDLLVQHPDLKENKFISQLQTVTPKGEGNPYFRLTYNTRLKNDPIFTEELQNGYKALQSHYSPEVRLLSKTLFNYLTIKDNLSPRNESFIKLVNPSAFNAISVRLKGGLSQNGNQIFGTKELFQIEDNEEFKVKFESLYKEKPFDSRYRFIQLWFSQKVNRDKVLQYLPRNKKISGYIKNINVDGQLTRTFDFTSLSTEQMEEIGVPVNQKGKVYFPMVFREYHSASEVNPNPSNTIWIRQKDYVPGNKVSYTKLQENRNHYLSPYALEFDQVVDESKRTPITTSIEPGEEIVSDIELPSEPRFEGNIIDTSETLTITNSLPEGNDWFQRDSNQLASTNLIQTLDKLSKRFGIEYKLDETMDTLGRFKDGVVYINPQLAKADTSFHEFSHPFIQVVKKENPALYKNLVRQIQVEGSILSQVQKTYTDLSLNDQIEEAIVTAIGQYAANQNQPKGLIAAIRQFLKRVSEFFKGVGVTVPSELSPNMTLSELGVLVGGDNQIDLTDTNLVSWDQRVLLQPTPLSPLDRVIEDIKLNLTRQINIYKNRVNSDSQKNYLAKLEGILTSMTDDISGVSSFITQASTTLGNLRERMDKLSDQKTNSEQIRELVQIGELAQSFSLLDDIKTAVRGELDSTEYRNSPFVNMMKSAISEREDILVDYREKGIPLLANYLFDQYDDSINSTLVGDLERFALTKEKLISQLKENPRDISTIAKMLYPAINTDDAVLSLFAKGLKRQLDEANQLDIEVDQELLSAKSEYMAESGISDDKIRSFNDPFIEEVDFKYNGNDIKRLRLIDESSNRWKTLTPAGKRYHQTLKKILLDSQNNIPESSKIGTFLPGIRKSPEELALEGDLSGAAKEKLKELTTFQVDDENFGLQTLTGDQAKFIPIYYASTLEASETSHELIQSILKYSQSTNKYRAYNQVHGEVNLTMDIVGSRTTLENNSKGENKLDSLAKRVGIDRYLKKEGTSNTYERLKSFIDMEYYGEREDKITVNVNGKDISVNKVFGSLASATSIISLAGNVLQGVNNVVIGNYMTVLESVGGRYFNKTDLAKGSKDYWKNVPSLTADISNKGYKSEVGQLADMYDAIQGKFRDSYGREVSGSVARKLMSTDSLFFFQTAGEHQIQLTNFLAFLHGQKVKQNGEMISLRNAYEKDSKGKMVLKPGVEWTNDQRRDLMNKIHKVNKESNGVYNKFDSLQLQKSAFGKMALIFRKFIVPTIRKRYDGLRVDYEENALAEGYYRTMWRLVISDLPNFKRNVVDQWSTLQPFERENIRKTLLEIGTMTLLFITLLGMGDDDDEKKSYLSALTLYEAKRLQSDLLFYTPGLGLKDQWRVLKSPTAIYSTVEKTASVLGQALYYNYKTSEFGFTEEYKRDSGLNKKGDSKLWSKTKKVIPIISKIELATDPQTAYNSFLKANQ